MENSPRDLPHIPVLLEPVIASFQSAPEGYVVDCTLGYAGHSSALLEHYPHLAIVGIDRDEEALDFSCIKLEKFGTRTRLYRGAFSETLSRVKERPIVGVLADFGVSSLQLDKMERGFSFESDRLDMRMDSSAKLTAYDVINSYTQEQISYIFHHYGEIKQADELANAIIRKRTAAPIESAKELSVIGKELLYAGGKIHPATLMFQAIRIEVNNELGEIEGLLNAIETIKPPGAIISLITFHSLEDRLVKNRFKQWAQRCTCDPEAMRCTCGGNNALGKIVTKKPIVATQQELRANPRSRSAKLRCFHFKGA